MGIQLIKGAKPSLPVIRGDVALEDHSQLVDLGKQLVNSGAFDWILGDIPELGIKAIEDKDAARMALVLYNQLAYATRPTEANDFGVPTRALEDIQTTDLNLPTKWSLPIIRRIYPAIFQAPMFATQPMPGPLAYAFYFDLKREADGTDFRAIAPFTAFVAASTTAGATTLTAKVTQNAGLVGFSPYQIVAGQVVTYSLGTGNAENLTVISATLAGNTFTITTAATTKNHTAGDIIYVTAPALSAEAGIPAKAKLSLTRTSVTANKWVLAATWTTEALEDARAQLNLDIEGEMVNGIANEIGREIFSTIIGDIIQQATGGATTLPAIGASAVQDYRYLAVQPIFTAEAQIYARRFHDCDTILCGLDMAANLQKQDNFHLTPANPNDTLSQLGVTHLGTFQGKFSVYKTMFLPPASGLIFMRPTDWLHAGYVYMPYIPLAPMPLVYAGYSASTGNYTNTDEWTRNVRTRAGRLFTVTDEFGVLAQG